MGKKVNTLKSTVLRKSAGAAVWISSYVRPRYMPPILFDGGEALATRLDDQYQKAMALGHSMTDGIFTNYKQHKFPNALSRDDATTNIRKLNDALQVGADVCDPDALAAKLIELFCVGLPQMDSLDNQRRIAATWSAILAPDVVLREKSGRTITALMIANSGVDWIRHGYTQAAADTYKARDTRFISAHPARMYHLVADRSQEFGLDHAKMMESLIAPILVAMGYHRGAWLLVSGKTCDGQEPLGAVA